jgi:hypothetical protein
MAIFTDPLTNVPQIWRRSFGGRNSGTPLGSGFRRGICQDGPIQLIAAGEQPIGVTVNAETAAEMRDKGAPLGFSVLPPRIIKPNGFFVAKKAPHPHAALLFTDWSLSEEGQKVLAVDLGKGVAMKGIPSKYKEFQGEPDYVVGPE